MNEAEIAAKAREIYEEKMCLTNCCGDFWSAIEFVIAEMKKLDRVENVE